MPLAGLEKQLALASAWRNRKDSVEWFSPLQLLRTAQKVKNSQTIASHADHREIQAGFAEIYDDGHEVSFHDFSKREQPFIFDFVADTGDGWDATVAVGDLLLRDSITADGHTLPRANIVIFGGDLVYPTAGRHDYKCRFIGPFLTAADRHHLPYPQPEDRYAESSPRVYAIPGNHDWYDGLTAFWSLFCRARLRTIGGFEKARWVGPWVAEQQRSYFALRLPENWWVWGIDVQLWEWVDTPQRHYFEDLADRMKHEFPGAKLIICTAEPSWVFGQSDNPQQFRALSYMANRAMTRGIEVRAVLSGDLHHYSRYVGTLTAGDRVSKQEHCQFVTAGGGGAFSAPTHALEDTLEVEIKDDGYWPLHYARLDACFARAYPERSTSKRTALRIPFLLAWRNPTFFLWLVLLWAAVSSWQWHGFPVLAAIPIAGFTLFARFGKRAFNESIDPILDCPGIKKMVGQLWWIPLGLVHGVFQGLAFHCLALRWTVTGGPWRYLEAGVLGALLCTFVMGVYLAFCSLALDVHHNEAFSALRLTDWKNFLRIRFDASGAMMYVIGIDEVPKDTNSGRQNVGARIVETIPL